MNSIFEMAMMILFGVSWPFAIYKTLKVKSVKGVSGVFSFLVLFGYISGIIHKILYNTDWVIIFYAVNTVNVVIYLALYLHYRNK